MGVALRKRAAVGGKLSYPYETLLPSAGSFRTPTKRCCRPQEAFVPLRNVAAIGRRFSYPYETLLPSAGGFRRATPVCFSRSVHII